MGIRFRCHHCDHELHVKDFQAGRRGRCPECGGKFRIPGQDATFSEALTHAELRSSRVENSAEYPAPQSQPAGENKDSENSTEKPSATQQRAGSSRVADDLALRSGAAPQPATAANQLPTHKVPKSEKASAIGEEVDSYIASTSAIADALPAGPLLGDAALPKAILEAPSGVWYVRPIAGGQYGPAPSETFGQWLNEGRVSRDALVWRDDWSDWYPAGQVLNDYFGPEPIAGSSPGVGNTQATRVTRESPPAPVTSLLGSNRIGRRQQKRRRYMIVLTVLTVLFICLMVALVVVLIRQ